MAIPVSRLRTLEVISWRWNYYVLALLILSGIVFGQSASNPSVARVDLIPESGGGSIFIEERAACQAVFVPADSPKSYRFSRVAKSGLRFDDVGGRVNIFDCTGKCSDGDSLSCAAFASAVPPPAPAPCEPVCSLDAYLSCQGQAQSAVSSLASAALPVTDSCLFTKSVRTKTVSSSETRIHDIVCVRQDPVSEVSKFVIKECAGDEEPIVSSNWVRTGASEKVGLRYETSLRPSDDPKKVAAGLILNPSAGAVSLDVLPTWPGGDNRDYRFFHYFKDDGNQIILEKNGSDNSMSCVYAVDGVGSAAKVSVSSWIGSVQHRVLMQWNVTAGLLNCSVDGISSRSGLPKAVSFGASPQLSIGGSLDGGKKAASSMSIGVWRTPFPSVAYCAADETWAYSLDLKGKASCTEAKIPWTGTACCGEFNDRPEFYNDPMPLADASRMVCVPGARVCDGNKIKSCGFDFNFSIMQECPNGCVVYDGLPMCAVSAGTSSGSSCVPNTASCQGSNKVICNLDGSQAVFSCTYGCMTDSNGAVYCAECSPGRSSCAGNLKIICGQNGIVSSRQACDIGQSCDPNTGQCSASSATGGVIAELSGGITGLAVAGSVGIQYPYDASSPGVCWNSTYIPNGIPIGGTGSKVIAAAGRLLGCGLSQADPLLLMKDKFRSSLPLIEPVGACTLAHDINGNPNFNLYCSPKISAWKSALSNKDVSLSANPTDPNDKDCCVAGDSCWDGATCIPDQTLETELKVTRGFRCIKGQWIEAVSKLTSDRSGKGFCPQKTDCLVNPRGSPINNYQPDKCFSQSAQQGIRPQCSLNGPACLSDRQYFIDDLCLDGNWTSRTKAIALELLDFAVVQSPNDYTLFCGDYTDVLNVFSDMTLGSGSIREYLGQTCSRDGMSIPCVNNFCALRYSVNKVAFGTSINVPIDDSSKSFLKALGLSETACNGAAVDDGLFHSCTSSVSYNHALQAVVVKPAASAQATGAAIAPPVAKPSLKRSQEPLIYGPLSALRLFFDNSGNKIFKDPLVNATRFDNLFVLRGSDRHYFGFLEKDVSFSFDTAGTPFSEFVDVGAIAYDGITVSDSYTNKQACEFINDSIDPSKLKSYSCVYDGSRLRMAALEKTAASGATGYPLRVFWRDLTSKLR